MKELFELPKMNIVLFNTDTVGTSNGGGTVRDEDETNFEDEL